MEAARSRVARLRRWRSEVLDLSGWRLYMWCPGCTDLHAVEVDPARQPCWTWDGNIDAPTVAPSIRVQGVQWAVGETFHKPNHHVAPGEAICCHSYVTAGSWVFLDDCTHNLKGTTVPLPPLPAWFGGPPRS